VVIWDFETRGVAKVLGWAGAAAYEKEHGDADGGAAAGATATAAAASGAGVTAVAWSRSGRRLLAGDAEGKVVLWDVVAGTKVRVHAVA
jgi:hypothetical protein